MDIGQVVVKLNGRFAGRVGIVIDTKDIDQGYVNIAIPYAEGKIKIKKTNLKHILPMGKSLKLKDKSDEKSVWEAIDGSGMHDLFVKRLRV